MGQSNRSQMKSLSLSLLGLATLCVAGATVNFKLSSLDSLDMVPRYFEPSLVRPEWLRFSTFGNSLSYMDWRWIKVLTDPNLEFTVDHRRSNLAVELDLATQIDPYFYPAYFYGSHLLSVVHNDGQGAQTILERGLANAPQAEKEISPKVRPRYWPSTANIATLLGYVYLFDIGDFEAANRAFTRAAEDPTVARHIQLLNKRLGTYKGRLEVAERVYRNLSKEDMTEKQRSALNDRITTIRVLKEIYDLQVAFEPIRKTTSRGHLSLAFREYLSKIGHSGHDLLGGEIYLDDAGEIQTHTVLHPPKGLTRDRSS